MGSLARTGPHSAHLCASPCQAQCSVASERAEASASLRAGGRSPVGMTALLWEPLAFPRPPLSPATPARWPPCHPNFLQEPHPALCRRCVPRSLGAWGPSPAVALSPASGTNSYATSVFGHFCGCARTSPFQGFVLCLQENIGPWKHGATLTGVTLPPHLCPGPQSLAVISPHLTWTVSWGTMLQAGLTAELETQT